MDDRRFDRLTRALATSAPRRLVTWALGSVVLVALLALLGTSDDSAGKRRRKKKKPRKPPGCRGSCLNKDCGQDDGCGAPCTVPAGCASTAACIDGRCVPGVCPNCTGNHICNADGSCTCPPGLKECAGAGYFGNCHECCATNGGTFPDPDCEGNPNGDLCPGHDEDLVLRCGCFRPRGCEEFRNCQVNCNGKCGECCDNAGCLFKYEDENRVCNAMRGCECKPGTQPCLGSGLCRDQTDPRSCGAICQDCGPGFSCENGNCCIGLANPCLAGSQLCCSGLTCVPNQQGTEFVCG